MSTHLVCPICGKQFECGPHERGSDQRLEPVQGCPLKKGAIYVFVKDDLGAPVGKVITHCGDKKPVGTDKEGFAFYEQLDEGKYPTSISLEESDVLVQDPHYTFVRTTVTATVNVGKITLVEFQLHRYADVQVEVKRTDNQKLVSDVAIRVDADESADNPPKQDENSLESGPVSMPKFKPTGVYTAKIALVKVHEKKYKISGKSEQPGIKVKAGAPNKIEFLVDPIFWLKLAVVEGKTGVPGTITLQQSGKGAADHPTQNDGTLEFDELEAGAMTVNKVDTTAGDYEFASITPGD